MKKQWIALTLVTGFVLSTAIVFAQQDKPARPERPQSAEARRTDKPARSAEAAAGVRRPEEARVQRPESAPDAQREKRPAAPLSRTERMMAQMETELSRQIAEQQKQVDEIKAILAIAESEEAPKTVAALRELVQAKEKQIEGIRQMHEQRLTRMKEMMQDRNQDRGELRQQMLERLRDRQQQRANQAPERSGRIAPAERPRSESQSQTGGAGRDRGNGRSR